MAYLSGLEHGLYLAEENTYGELVSTDFATCFDEGFTAFTRPGSRPSIQGGVLNADIVGRTLGSGRSRTFVTGGFYSNTKFYALYRHLKHHPEYLVLNLAW
jgi:hypothetical protein